MPIDPDMMLLQLGHGVTAVHTPRTALHTPRTALKGIMVRCSRAAAMRTL